MGQPVAKPRALCTEHRAERRREKTRQRMMRRRTDGLVRSVLLGPSQTKPILEALNEVSRLRSQLDIEQANRGRPQRATFLEFLTATDRLRELASTALTAVAEDVTLSETAATRLDDP
jgi:hypothetical protein